MRAMMSASEIIDVLGGTNSVAAMLGIRPPSVSEWKKAGIPEDKLIRLGATIEKATGGACHRRDLRPDDWQIIWPELAQETERVCR